MLMVGITTAMITYPLILYQTGNLGIEAPRITNSGDELPNARLVSATVIGGHGRPMPGSTLALMQWGQFINHDFQSTAQYSSCKD